MSEKTVPTYNATIYVGRKHRNGGSLVPEIEVFKTCQDYVNEFGLGVSIQATGFIYTNGYEPGFAIGLINYPRFPSTPEEIREHALALAEKLRNACGQRRVSVVTIDETIMLSD